MPHPVLTVGSADVVAVRQLQELLNRHQNSLVVDGDFGGRTRDAVTRFQNAQGLRPADGIATLQVWARLEETAPSGRRAVVTATQLNLRDAPAGPSVVRVLARGDSVEVVAQNNDWYRVRIGGLEGYVNGDYLSFADLPNTSFLCESPTFRALPLAATRPVPIPAERVVSDIATSWNRCGGLLGPLAHDVGIDVSAAVAVLQVESAGTGFVNGRMVIRFEVHVFARRVPKDKAAVVAASFRYDASEPWKRHAYRSGDRWISLHVPTLSLADNQDLEWRALALAQTIDPEAALQAISMGSAQVMGFNFARIGYSTAGAMFQSLKVDERFHVLALFDYVRGPSRSSDMVVALQRRRWEDFAALYNGSGQASVYAGRISAAVSAANRLPLV